MGLEAVELLTEAEETFDSPPASRTKWEFTEFPYEPESRNTGLG